MKSTEKFDKLDILVNKWHKGERVTVADLTAAGVTVSAPVSFPAAVHCDTAARRAAARRAAAAAAADPAAADGFHAALRAYETAVLHGTDTAAALDTLGNISTFSVLKYCTDPQRKAAPARPAVSDSGLSPVMVGLKNGLVSDNALLHNLKETAAAAFRLVPNADGDLISTPNRKAAAAFHSLTGETLSDGTAVKQECILAILEETAAALTRRPVRPAVPAARRRPVLSLRAAHGPARLTRRRPSGPRPAPLIPARLRGPVLSLRPAHGPAAYTARRRPLYLGFLEAPYIVREINKRVLIHGEMAGFHDVSITPISRIFRAVNRYVNSSGSVAVNPKSHYVYIADMVTDTETESPAAAADVIYHRLGRFADLGGDDAFGPSAGLHDLYDYNNIMARLSLNERQAVVVSLRLRGYGKKAIGQYLNVDPANVGRTLKQIQKKCEKLGFSPEMWAEMTGESVKIARNDNGAYNPAAAMHPAPAPAPAAVPTLGRFDISPAAAAAAETARRAAARRAAAAETAARGAGMDTAFAARRADLVSRGFVCSVSTADPAAVAAYAAAYTPAAAAAMHPAPVGTYAARTIPGNPDPVGTWENAMDETAVNRNREKREKAAAAAVNKK